MKNIFLVSWLTFKESNRNKALHGIMLLAFISCLLYATIIPMFAFDMAKVAIDLGFAIMTLAGLSMILFMGIQLISRDIHQRTVCMILCRPISRNQYVHGKFLGMALTIFLAILFLGALAILAGWIGCRFIPGMTPPRNFSWALLFSGILLNYLSLLILLALSFLFTIVTSSSYMAILMTFCIYLAGNSIETVLKIMKTGDFVQSSRSYEFLLDAFSWVLPNFRIFDIKIYISYGLDFPLINQMWAIFYGISYMIIILVITSIIFSRKEIT
jgi:ABC-type transport system involved in multi-copper enzyme maturation permease subunit